MHKCKTHLVEVIPAPLRGLLSCVPIEDREGALPADIVKVGDKGVRVLHRLSATLLIRDTDAERRVVRRPHIQALTREGQSDRDHRASGQ